MAAVTDRGIIYYIKYTFSMKNYMETSFCSHDASDPDIVECCKQNCVNEVIKVSKTVNLHPIECRRCENCSETAAVKTWWNISREETQQLLMTVGPRLQPVVDCKGFINDSLAHVVRNLGTWESNHQPWGW